MSIPSGFVVQGRPMDSIEGGLLMYVEFDRSSFCDARTRSGRRCSNSASQHLAAGNFCDQHARPELSRLVQYPNKGGERVASRLSEARLFHRKTCGAVANISKGNRLEFVSREDALAAGFKPCRECHAVDDLT